MPVLRPLSEEATDTVSRSSVGIELKALFKHTSVYGIGSVLSKLAGFVLIPFYTHYLTPADYGTLELLDLSIGLFGITVMTWMGASAIRYYYEYEDQENRSEFVSTVLVAASVLGILAAILGIAFSPELSALVLKSPGSYKYFWLLSITFGFSTLNSVSFSFLRAKQQSGLVTIMSVASMILSLSLNIYFIAVLHLGVAGILLSSLISIALSAITLTLFTLREAKLSFNVEKLRALVVFGAPLVVNGVSAFALNFSDRFFLQHFTNAATVGIYALGYKFGFMLTFLVVQPFDMIWSSRVYEIARKQNGAELFSRIFRYYTFVLVLLALGLSLAAKDIIAIVAAPSFREAYKIVPVVALAYVFQGAYRFMVGGIFLEKKTYHVGMIGAVSLAANLILNYLLVRPYQGMGAAWATVLSFALMAGLAYVVSKRAYPAPYSVGPFLLSVLIAALMYLGAAGISRPSVVFSAGLGAIVLASFPLALYMTGFFNKNEVKRAMEKAQALWATYGWSAFGLPRQ